MNFRVGIDLVRISGVAESIERFGDRFLRRVFTQDEIAYAMASPAHTLERLAVRFAAKEAAIKALDLAERGIGWTQIEIARQASGAPRLILRGAAAEAAGPDALAVSLSHEGDYATAIVVGEQRRHGRRDPSGASDAQPTNAPCQN